MRIYSEFQLILTLFSVAMDGIVVLSTEWATFYQTLTQTPITIIANAVELPKQYKYHSQSKQIITLGRLGERKGTYDILKLAGVIQSRFPDIQFTLYGDGEQGKVQQEIDRLKLTNVRLGGWLALADRNTVIQESLLHLLPSYQEGLPMAILETMAYGIPNLATNVGGIPQVIENHVNGDLVTPGDDAGLVQQLSDFLGSQMRRETYSRNARQTINDCFSLQQYFSRWHQFYQRIMNETEEE